MPLDSIDFAVEAVIERYFVFLAWPQVMPVADARSLSLIHSHFYLID